MNFEWDGALASRQDRIAQLLKDGAPIPAAEYAMLAKNAMVRIAAVLAPCNLVVRHYCLLYVIERKPGYLKKIILQCKIISYESCCLWAEGYSYWCYTRNMLELVRAANDWIDCFILLQDHWFQMTAYGRAGILYPPPFGDVIDEPMQSQALEDQAWIYPVVYIDSFTYHIHARPVRFNLHTEAVDREYKIADGRPVGFKYYEGYQKKYPTKWSEILALLRRAIVLLTARVDRCGERYE